ncbi:unnamed protein product [Ectocarpus sp. 6 AP-2014]
MAAAWRRPIRDRVGSSLARAAAAGGGGSGGNRWTRRRDGELFDDSTPREPWTFASGTAGGRSQAGGGGVRDRSDGGNVYGYPPLAPGPHHPHVHGRLPVSSPAAGGWAGSARASRTEAAAEQQHGFLDASSSCAPGGVDQKMLQSVLPPSSASSAAAAAAAAGSNGGRDFVKEPPQQSLWKQEGCPRGSESDEAMAIRIGGGSGSGSGGGGEPQHYHQLQLDEAVNVGIGGGDSWGGAVRGDDAGGGGRVVGDGTDQNRHVGGRGGRGGGGSGDSGGGEAGGAVCADLVGMLLDD